MENDSNNTIQDHGDETTMTIVDKYFSGDDSCSFIFCDTATHEQPCHMDVELPNDMVDFFPLAAQTYGHGEHLFDSYGGIAKGLWKSNIYYPFSCRSDWQVAKWLTDVRASVADTDRFFKLDYVRITMEFFLPLYLTPPDR